MNPWVAAEMEYIMAALCDPWLSEALSSDIDGLRAAAKRRHRWLVSRLADLRGRP